MKNKNFFFLNIFFYLNSTLLGNLISISQIEYEGAFRLPASTFGASNLNYASGIIEYNRNNHTLFIVGNTHEFAIAEFRIPELVKSFTISELNIADPPIQKFTTVIDRLEENVELLDSISGLELVNSELLVNLIKYYDADLQNTQSLIVIRDSNNLSNSQIEGPFTVSEKAGHAAGWISPIPNLWQSNLGGTHLMGHSSGIPIISRLSVGPSAFSFNPSDIVGNGFISEPIFIQKLLDFPLSNGLSNDLKNHSLNNDLWTHLSRASFGFIPTGTSTYVTIGSSNGHVSGIYYKTERPETNCPGYCTNDPNEDRTPYYWLWDVNDLVAVRNGELAPYNVRPYDYGVFNVPFPTESVSGGSYDPESGLLYLTLRRADNEQGNFKNPPIIAVYKIFNNESPPDNVITVSTESELQTAITSLVPGVTIEIAPGTYNLSNTLYIHADDVTIRGATENSNDVVLVGNGMDNSNYGSVPHGIWTDAYNLQISNLTIGDVWFHPISLDGNANSPQIQNVRLFDAGEQFIKSNSGGGVGLGCDNGIVENCLFEYTNQPPSVDHGGGIGYFNGVDIHGGNNWIIRNNRFVNLHNPDGTDHPYAPAILMWNGSENTLVGGNTFINCDRSIALGLIERTPFDHEGGIIRNNIIYMDSGLFSSSRSAGADGAILVWDSAHTKVLHNTVIVNGNHPNALQFRFNTTGSEAKNNLMDATIRDRENDETYFESGNTTNASLSLFVNPSQYDLLLKSNATLAQEPLLSDCTQDIQGELRQGLVDVGADELINENDVVADSDSDGITDLHEILMGTDPNDSNSANPPVTQFIDGTYTFSFQRTLAILSNPMSLEISYNLENWSKATELNGSYDISKNDNNTENIKFSYDGPNPVFFRLKIDK